MSSFPWPLTDDQLLLNQALEDVLAASHNPKRDKGDQDWLRTSAVALILNGYEQGVRDRETLVHNALTIMGFKPRRR